MKTDDSQCYIKQTQAWLDKVIVSYNLCPFAKAVIDSQQLGFVIDPADTTSSQLHNLILQCEYMQQHSEIATLLLLYPASLKQFDDFLDYLAIAEAILVEQGYEGVFQLASFHPEYCFEDSDPDDPANFTNRSPYPMLHILREADIEQALRNYRQPENIPERNITTCRRLGLEKMRSLLAASYDIKTL